MRKPKIRFISGSLLFVALVFTFHSLVLAAPPSTAQEERAAEVIREDEELRSRIEYEQKAFIEEVVVNGASVLSKEELEEAALPFVGQRLSQKDIEGLVDAVKQLYKKHAKNIPEISFQIKQNTLEVAVKE